jgi:hypothetical protein
MSFPRQALERAVKEAGMLRVFDLTKVREALARQRPPRS